MSSQSKDNNRDRKSKSIRLSQKLRGLRDLRLRVSIEGKPHLQRRGSLQQSPQEEEEYRIVHTPDRPQRFISPVEAPTEDDCYDALRTWHHAAEQQRSGVHLYGIQQQRSGGAGEPGSTGVDGATNEDDDGGSRGSPFVPDPSDDAKTPKDEKWWELAYGEFKEVEEINPFREWRGDHQQKETQDQPGTNTGQIFRQDTAKGGPLRKGAAPSHLLTDFTGLPSKTYSTSEADENDIFNGTNDSKGEYTPSVYTPSQKSPTTPTPEMFPEAPRWTFGRPPAKSTTAAPETLLTRDVQRACAIDSDSESTIPPGGRYFDIDEEYDPSGGTRKSSISCKPTATSISDQQQHPRQLPSPPPPQPKSLDNTGRGFLFPTLGSSGHAMQTLHTELLKLAHKQHEQERQKRGRGSGQSGDSGRSGSTSSAFYSAFTSSPRPETPDVRPPSRRGEQQQQQQTDPSQGTHELGIETAIPSTPRPKPKQTQQKRRYPITPPRGFLKERGPYIPPSSPGTTSSSPRPPTPPPKTPETKAVAPKPRVLLKGLDFSPSRPVPPTPTPTPTKPKSMGSTGMRGVGGHMGGHLAGTVSISSLSSLSSLTGGSGVAITPPRVSSTKLKAPPPAPPPPPGGDEGGLLVLPKTVYNGNSKARMPVKMPVPVPSLLSKFNTSHASPLTSREHGPSTPNRLSPQSQDQNHIQGQERKRHQRGSTEFSIHIQPRLSDPFVDSPASGVDTLGNRLSVGMVDGLYDEGQAKAWEKTMSMMTQTQKPAHVQVYTQGQAKVRELQPGNTQSQKQVQGQGQAQIQSENLGKMPLQTQTQIQPKVQEKVNLAFKTPPPSIPPSQGYPLEPNPQTSSPGSQAHQPQSTPQTPPRFQAYQAQPALRTPSPRTIPFTPSLTIPFSLQTHLPRISYSPNICHHPSTAPDSNSASNPHSSLPAPTSSPFIPHTKDKEQKNREQQQQQQQQQRPVSAGSDGGGDSDSSSSYESLQFWKNPTPTPGPTLGPGMTAPVQRSSSSGISRGDQRPGQVGQSGQVVGHEGEGRYEFQEGDDEDEEEKDSTAVVETESGTTVTGKGITVSVVVDDYADIIDQYAGGWRETMFSESWRRNSSK
ncbi:hypothetical protein NEUTE1DRAFT_144410 [Neurospora tetrasperma FGSC 2508]|uniref:Uncharacterized protein n=1 Tax=Neurospora tetrasperma (strain FGSC 2508 / ATCC MYA-4615 / P0657) TaxID=510951 RepID=F8MBM9_NEUT8|nr:uncharacterized protein NEUTE1DRAFT_144410 [Neurospora tetrasperma FGSC 2508]EGO61141.1 hypothetical protein NEUTE1DRAFT_144410 [Neurospora tetrasperma FGSC 2508]